VIPVRITLGVLIASFTGLGFYFVVSDRFRRVPLYLFASNVFFFIGQFISQKMGWTHLRIGANNLLPAILSSLIGLVLLRYLAGSDRKIRSRR
jgi:hypothetical protein